MDRRHRSLAIGTLAAALVAAVLTPAAAAAKTSWVDDDGKAGPTSCTGTATAKTAIQAAIKGSGTGDTVKVCPGTYTGRLKIPATRDGLKLIAATTTKPVIQVGPTASTTILTIDGADDVTLRGLTLRSDSTNTCGSRGGIQVGEAKRAILSGLRIESVGATTLSGCQLSVGITIADASATITNVRIVDASSNGILAYGASTVTVKTATVDYLHALDSGPTAGIMVKIQQGAKGSLKDVTVNGLATAGSSTPQLAIGVEIQDAAVGVAAQDITVSHTLTGLRIVRSRDASVTGVDVTGATTGVWLDSGKGADVSGVTVLDTDYGISVASATGATIHDNDLTGATAVGCDDQTTGGTGTLGTKNTWTNNLTSTSSSPAGLCTEP